MMEYAKLALNLARSREMFIVLDADALFMVGQDISLIKGYHRAVVTPNVVEFKRLSEQVGVDPKTPAGERAGMVSRELGGVTVLQKGAKDIISVDTNWQQSQYYRNSKETVEVDIEGG